MRALVAAILVPFAAGCATTRSLGEGLSLEPNQEITAADYDEVLQRWTREDRVYDKLESRIFVRTTFHSPEFRKAFLLRHQDVYGRGSEEARRLALTQEGAEEQLEFFLAVYTPQVTSNDLDRPDSIWRITLEGDEGDRVDAAEIVRVKPTANLRIIYPYITDFSRAYVVRFPVMTFAGKPVVSNRSQILVLRVVSALGEASVSWALRPTERVAPARLPAAAP